MHSAALALVWLASLVPLLLERSGALDLDAGAPGAAPRVGLCALVWLALGGAPRARILGDSTAANAGARNFDAPGWWASAMAALPVLALAALLDGGVARPASAALDPALLAWKSAAIAALLVTLALLASDLARTTRRAHALHAVLWFAFVLGLPLFLAATRYGARVEPGPAPGALEGLASASPLAWALALARGPAASFPALLSLLGLCALTALAARAHATGDAPSAERSSDNASRTANPVEDPRAPRGGGSS